MKVVFHHRNYHACDACGGALHIDQMEASAVSINVLEEPEGYEDEERPALDLCEYHAYILMTKLQDDFARYGRKYKRHDSTEADGDTRLPSDTEAAGYGPPTNTL